MWFYSPQAYALAGGGSGDRGGDAFGNEAVRTLLTEVENHRTSVKRDGVW